MSDQKVRVAVTGYGVIGKRVADCRLPGLGPAYCAPPMLMSTRPLGAAEPRLYHPMAIPSRVGQDPNLERPPIRFHQERF